MRLIATLLTGTLVVIVSNIPPADALPTGQKAETHRDSVGNLKLGFLDGTNEGCGCEFTFLPEIRKDDPRFVFMSDEEEKKAFINIDGRNIALTLIRSTNPRGRERVGNRSTRTYEGEGIRVSAAYVATRVCKKYDEACESTDYDGTFTLTKDRRKRIARLKGVCGC